MPRRLLAVQSRELMAVLRKLERALKERRYERVAALLEDNKEVLRAKQPDDVVERVRVWEEQVAGLLARRGRRCSGCSCLKECGRRSEKEMGLKKAKRGF